MFESCSAAAAIVNLAVRMGCAICALRSTDRSPYPELRFGGYRADYVFPNREFLYCGTREIALQTRARKKLSLDFARITPPLAPSDRHV